MRLVVFRRACRLPHDHSIHPGQCQWGLRVSNFYYTTLDAALYGHIRTEYCPREESSLSNISLDRREAL